MNPETKFKVKVQKHLKNKYPGAWLWKTADMWTSGIPDQLMLYEGYNFWFELKVLPNKATKIQLAIIDRINKAGGFAGVCYTIKDVEDIIKEALGENFSN